MDTRAVRAPGDRGVLLRDCRSARVGRQAQEEHLRLFNPWVIGMINVHEAYPGHYTSSSSTLRDSHQDAQAVAVELELRGLGALSNR